MRNRIVNYIRGLIGTSSVLSRQEDLIFEHRKNQMIDHILHDSEMGVTDEKYTDHDIIVSLTSHGNRIYDVAFAIESIMQQSMKANRIILWLDEGNKNHVPESLVLLQKRGLEIAYCEDLGPYTKLVPSLRSFPDDVIITIDDDAIYEYDILERLITAYLSDPSFIYCCRARRIQFADDGELAPYNQWKMVGSKTDPSHLFFATGIGGVLYPPHSLDEEVVNSEAFTQICKTADDVWFNAMAMKKGTRVIKVYTRNPNGDDYLLNKSVQDVGLLNVNYKGGMLNDKLISAVFSRYDILPLLRKERTL